MSAYLYNNYVITGDLVFIIKKRKLWMISRAYLISWSTLHTYLKDNFHTFYNILSTILTTHKNHINYYILNDFDRIYFF